MNRRGFLSALVGVVAAPAIVRSESLMRIWVPPVSTSMSMHDGPLTLDMLRNIHAALLKNALPKQVLMDARMLGTGAAQTYMEGGLIRFRRVSPFELFQEADT